MDSWIPNGNSESEIHWEKQIRRFRSRCHFIVRGQFYNPVRVFPNNDGSELVFTVYRRPDVSDQEFAADAAAVEKDLAKLKTLLEK